MKLQESTFKRTLACVALALGTAVQALPAAAAEAEPLQILDRVYAYNTGAVLNMHFGNLDRSVDHFTDQHASASLISTCTLTSVDGLWCLDGGLLRKWSDPIALMETPENVLSCTDAALNFDATCTGMTVDKSGVIWLAGKKRPASNARNSGKPPSVYIVVKVTEKGSATSCTPANEVTELSPLDGVQYCATEVFSGKYEITQLSPVDGDAAKVYQAGVLAIEDLKNVLFIPAQGAPPFLIPGNPQGNPKFGEILDDVSFVAFNGQGYVIATTNSGHVLAKNVTTGAPVLKVFHVPSERSQSSNARNYGPQKCTNAKSQYAIRGAPTSSVVFVSDRVYCQVLALAPNSNFTALENLPMPEGGGDYTLSTKDEQLGTFPTFGLTVASGIGISFASCGVECAFINSATGTKAAWLTDVQTVSGKSATVFQMKKIPDCRYAARFSNTTEGNARRTLCASLTGVVVNPPGPLPIDPLTGQVYPAAQMLNVIPLLPVDVASAFDSLPLQLLVSGKYRAQEDNDFVFDALFVSPGKHVQYKGVFNAHYDVPALSGDAEEACEPTEDLLEWDVTTAVSETFIGVNGRYIDSLANDGCGSVRGSYGRQSFLPINLEITPDTFGKTAKLWLGTKVTVNNDAVFARLVESLIDDLGYVFKELACKQADNEDLSTPPLSVADFCLYNSPARVKLNLVKANFDRCLIGAFTNVLLDNALPPSWRNRPYCAATLTALDLFHRQLPDPDGHDDYPPVDAHGYSYSNDIANRLGELHSRIDILEHVFTTRFQPSIPDKGYCKELHSCSLPF